MYLVTSFLSAVCKQQKSRGVTRPRARPLKETNSWPRGNDTTAMSTKHPFLLSQRATEYSDATVEVVGPTVVLKRTQPSPHT